MSKEKILYRDITRFNDILVTQEGNILTLFSPATVRQTAMDVNNPFLPHLEYARNTLLALALCPDPETILVLGLGGGSIPMMLANVAGQAHIDVVEIDTEIARVAKKYFYFNTSKRLNLFIDDASLFIKNSAKKYDVIISDAFMGNELPESLSTPEFFRETREHLSLEGILITNLTTGNSLNFKRMLNTISAMFQELWLLPSDSSNNTLVFSMNVKRSQVEIAHNAQVLQKDCPFGFPLGSLTSKLQHLQCL